MQHVTKRRLQPHYIQLESSGAQRDACSLAEILNDERITSKFSEIFSLVRDLKEIERLAEVAGFPKRPYRGALLRKTAPIFERVEPLLQKGSYILDRPTESGWQEAIHSRVKDSLFAIVLISAREGLLRRLAECRNCRRWFGTRKKNHLYCSSECRQKAFRKSERGKAKRAAYMRRYREGLRRLEKNYLRASKERR